MKNEENLKVTGRVNIQVINSGKVINSIDIDNLVVTTGRNWIAGLIVETSTSGAMSHMAVGTGTEGLDTATAEVLADTTLETELARVATPGTSSLNTATFSAIYNAGIATGPITEAAIFDASSGGVMLCRTTFDVVNIGSSDSMSITWTITVS
jgi:hypothetical protein